MRDAVVKTLSKAAEREAFLDAAYASIAVALVRLDEKGGKVVAELAPKPLPRGEPAADPGAFFDAALKAAVLRRSVEVRGRAVEAAALARAAELADRVDAKRAEPERTLPPERLKEIADILAEAEKAPRDPLVITPTWSSLRRGGK